VAQTAVAVRVRVAAQRAVFGIVCILPLSSKMRIEGQRSAWVLDPSRSGRIGERESAESGAETHLDPMRFSNLAY
jgi:hypothetical protein